MENIRYNMIIWKNNVAQEQIFKMATNIQDGRSEILIFLDISRTIHLSK